jgi:hypothetical protein
MYSLPEQELLDLGFEQRNIKKCLEFLSVTNGAIQGERVVDLCCGNGLCGFSFLYNGLAERGILVDKRFPSKSKKLESLARKYNLDMQFVEADITGGSFLGEGLSDNSFIVAIHPCSYLGDKVIGIGIENQTPFSLMTCCHMTKPFEYDLVNPPDPRLMLYDKPSVYFDLVRQRHIEEQGWKCVRGEISEDVTEKNQVIIGLPS